MADGDDKINGTTGGFTSAGLKLEEEKLVLPRSSGIEAGWQASLLTNFGK